ncbi:DUF2834 domain-containing protein [Mycobacterium mantenii]|uniref:DUF2834 domain-containing protein n=1 Tax=Mycobacterium mantenii TaxID=560555 RepID=A0A1A2TG10_MYCNT|nr:DUF2834 domain-containing protein [Mycobacterium mantenii]OBH47398.1 hypothetical protein A5688_03650 [Mycobacterium mantenii]OBH75314.1 hypothetical protein A5683_22675 [Mycobacterium mantenii]OBH79064.1 hypothetical protein A5682_18635 [Mycobacterium mantenii]
MTAARRNLCILYGAIALVALIATWAHNVAYFSAGGDTVDFLASCFANHAVSSMTIDLTLVSVAALVFMVVEARRIGVNYLWVYVALGFVVDISVAVPLFLIARERRLAQLQDV